jgi:hypothetical protein
MEKLELGNPYEVALRPHSRIHNSETPEVTSLEENASFDQQYRRLCLQLMYLTFSKFAGEAKD